MTWDLSDAHYPQINIKTDHVADLSKWLAKIAELTAQYEGDWNVLICDIWPNDRMSRLIGHVQMDDVAIGYDTGFRVCAYVKDGGIEGDEGNDLPRFEDWLTAAAKTDKTQKLLRDLDKKNPFEIRLTEYGSNPISKWPVIKF